MSVEKNKYVLAMEAVQEIPGVQRVWIETVLLKEGLIRVYQKAECKFPDNIKKEIFEVECIDPVEGFVRLVAALQVRLLKTIQQPN